MWTQRRSGQTSQRGKNDHRSPFERDQTRVIHSSSFRKLQRKTQILGTSEGDFHRTRLTHSLETASIGRSLVRILEQKHPELQKTLLPTEELISVICLLHDIGHPPFGHGGETALNYLMRTHGGFESNAQALRLLMKLENSYENFGLDLTRRTLLGILKYPVPYTTLLAKEWQSMESHRVNDWLPPKGYYDSEIPEVDWILEPFSTSDKNFFQSLLKEPGPNEHGKTLYHSFDCSIMDIADNIAYGIHDLEDAIHLNLIERDMLDTEHFQILFSHLFENTNRDLFFKNLFSRRLSERKEVIGTLVHTLVSRASITVTAPQFEHDFLKYHLTLTPEADMFLNYLIQTIYRYVIDAPAARTFEFGGQSVVLKLFQAISSNPEQLLDEDYRKCYQESTSDDMAKRSICDYIANMSDEYACRLHEKLFGFIGRSLFERF